MTRGAALMMRRGNAAWAMKESGAAASAPPQRSDGRRKNRQDAAMVPPYAAVMTSKITNQVRWAAAVGAAFLAEVVLIGAAFGWVALYSHVIAPGQPVAEYQAYAMRASPWVSIVVGLPLFFLLARALARPSATAWVMFVTYLLLDGALFLLLPPASGAPMPWSLVLLSYGSKALATAVGAHTRRLVAAP